MGKTNISWATHSVNPIRARDTTTGATGHWCLPTSPGCKFCYASKLQIRFKMHEYKAPNRAKIEPFFDQAALDSVIARKIPSVFFWCSMTDMFLDEWPDEWIDQCFATMYEAQWHVHMVLTKHPERMKQWSNDGRRVSKISTFAWKAWKRRNPDRAGILTQNDVMSDFAKQWPLPNVFMGVSVENPDYLWRLAELAAVKAAKRFVSAEPLLATIDLQTCLGVKVAMNGLWEKVSDNPILDYVVGGGESGLFARRCPPEAPRLLRDQCKEAGIPFQWKQWGEWVPYDDIPETILRTKEIGRKPQFKEHGVTYFKLGKHDSGCFVDGVEHLEMPRLEVAQ